MVPRGNCTVGSIASGSPGGPTETTDRMIRPAGSRFPDIPGTMDTTHLQSRYTPSMEERGPQQRRHRNQQNQQRRQHQRDEPPRPRLGSGSRLGDAEGVDKYADEEVQNGDLSPTAHARMQVPGCN